MGVSSSFELKAEADLLELARFLEGKKIPMLCDRLLELHNQGELTKEGVAKWSKKIEGYEFISASAFQMADLEVDLVDRDSKLIFSFYIEIRHLKSGEIDCGAAGFVPATLKLKKDMNWPQVKLTKKAVEEFMRFFDARIPK